MKAAKAGRNKTPAWKTKWPKSNDLRQWYLCALEKCEAFSDLLNAATQAHLPISNLAELDRTAEALKYVNRYLKRLKPLTHDNPLQVIYTASLEILRMARLGAEISVNVNDLDRMEKYLSIVLATEQLPRRKCDIGYPERAVRNFRAHHGLLDPADAIDEGQREDATFTSANRRFHQLGQAGDLAAAKAELKTMDQIARRSKDMDLYFRARRVMEGYILINDTKELKKALRFFAQDPSLRICSFQFLQDNGFEREAIKAAKDEVLERIAELESMQDPNIHFSIHFICGALRFLIQQHKQRDAKKLLDQVLASAKNWPGVPKGWTTSAVQSNFAEIFELLGQTDEARQLLKSAKKDASREKRSDFRRGAVSHAAEVEVKLQGNDTDAKLAVARKIRSPRTRRQELAKILVSARRWKELAAVGQEIPTPEEAFDLCWEIKFILPGGRR